MPEYSGEYNEPESIAFSWIEVDENGQAKRVVRALDIGYLFYAHISLQDTSLGREILAGLKHGASTNIWFSDLDAYIVEHGEEEQ